MCSFYFLILHHYMGLTIKINHQYSKEMLSDNMSTVKVEYWEENTLGELSAALDIVTKRATPAVQNGIKALRYASNGYSSREIGEKMDASDGKVRMWMTRAKRFLQAQPEILALTEI